MSESLIKVVCVNPYANNLAYKQKKITRTFMLYICDLPLSYSNFKKKNEPQNPHIRTLHKYRMPKKNVYLVSDRSDTKIR